MLVLNLTIASKKLYRYFAAAMTISAAVFLSGCFSAKTEVDTAVTSAVFENATKDQLIEQANQFSKIASMRANMKVEFVDTTDSYIGRSDKYQAANGEIIVQRPSSIYLKIEAPVVKVDITQMTSNGKNFRVAVLEDGGSGKYKQFVTGSNDADYSILQKAVSNVSNVGDVKERASKKNVNAFSNIRPQHFTEALLIQPLHAGSEEYYYVQSEIYVEEGDVTSKKSSPVARINNNYYLLEELKKKGDDLVLTRRFWFNRTNKVSIARQQIFTEDGVLESDITYGDIGNFTDTGQYNLPLRVALVRPKDKYKMTLTYYDPKAVIIGKEWNQEIFTLKNRWNLPEVNLDDKLEEIKKNGGQAAAAGDK